MSQQEKIEQLARKYADALRNLHSNAATLKAELRKTQQRGLPSLKHAAERAARVKEELKLTIKAAPALFTKPKTKTISNIKVGFKKQKGKVEIPDEEYTIKRMKKELPDEQVELLIRKTENVHKPAVYDLEARDLKRFGIRIVDDTDVVYIKQAITDLDKLINGWFEDEDSEEA